MRRRWFLLGLFSPVLRVFGQQPTRAARACVGKDGLGQPCEEYRQEICAELSAIAERMLLSGDPFAATALYLIAAHAGAPDTFTLSVYVKNEAHQTITIQRVKNI